MRKTDKFKRNVLSAGLCAALTLPALCGCSGQGDVAGLTGGVKRLSGVQEGSSPGEGSGQGSTPLGRTTVQDGSLLGTRSAQDGSMSGTGSAPDNTKPADASTVTDFAVRLFQENLAQEQEKNPNKNVLISPASVLFALSMTANGAKGQTLAQMEEVLGSSVPALNTYLYEYRTSLPEGDGYKLSIANSIWFQDDERFTVDADFLSLNEAWYNADIYKAPFDSSTLNAVNKWVSDATDKMIPKILDEIPSDAVMYLINGLAFDAEWDTVYKEYDVRESDFTDENGDTCRTEMMYSTENLYLQDDHAQGFLKYYKNKKYAFAALLPNEGVSVADYIASLDGNALHEMLSNPVRTSIAAALPKFEAEYKTEMSGFFAALGMADAFDSHTADLSGIGSSTAGNLFINRILHKTYIAVDGKGTRAGAVTAVEINLECALMFEHQIYLNRPFVYMIIDCEENVPVFIGTMMSVK